MAKISKFLEAILLGTCLSFVIYKSGKCISRYASGPTGIDLSMEDGTFEIFPDFLLCGRLNATVLENCGITWSDYKSGIWSVSNGSKVCQDPNVLIEKARIKLEDIIEETIVQYEKGGEVAINSSNNANLWSLEYDPKIGICYRFSISPNTHNDSVVSIRFYRGSSARSVFFNSPGYFHSNPRRRSYRLKQPKIVMELSYDIFKALNHNDKPCNNAESYTSDTCFEELAYKESMKLLNCTWPFNMKSSRICKDFEKATKAKIIGEKYFKKRKHENCLVPCNQLKAVVDGNVWEGKSDGRDYVMFKFKENVKVFEAYYTYNGLSLIAEIGGYVGLFLGWSVQQLFEIPKKLADIKRCMPKELTIQN